MRWNSPFLKWVIVLALFLYGGASILPHLFPNYWVFDLFSNFKVQLAFGGLVLFQFCLKYIKWKWLSAAFCVACLLWNLSFVLPYYLAHPTQIAEKSAGSLSLVSMNLLSENTEAERVVAFLNEEKPEVLVLLEYTPQWDHLLDGIKTTYPYQKLIPQDGHFGIAVWSKYEMQAIQTHFGYPDIPSIEAEIRTPSGPLTLIATHPLPPLSQNQFELRNKQLSFIARRLGELGGRVMVLGDLNLSSFSSHFEVLETGGFRDSRKGFGVLPTWPANYTWLGTTIDHALVAGNLKVIDRRVGPNIGSDHLPIIIQVAIPQ
ncbi:Uncharacterized conserved protein YafD, endonuclease/exonuclease/phosphatase (EEP) superfamily [Robiginitalea myxolifaciens]|uniref:Uncharacterized conserved protein YafD, endonuclease/exonuclease/phosphatase (EEP) superfamily n=1 Tax=Robiginitalea myxolifaciens TaxID=400055 RepID=A0A1I6HDB1_9FLAO|nr:endonuclease/exonuclease/phosphatase family protein [Robiginitalea myxolifaciens]SFR52472.1 Uncharacterized conserved protein YafD, endonuclease/exonuclease/phosphatase (EEP) superfamily [Robiginitalea myxolifaciens]